LTGEKIRCKVIVSSKKVQSHKSSFSSFANQPVHQKD